MAENEGPRELRREEEILGPGKIDKIRKWLFSVPPGDNSAWDIISWWEARRIPYNAIVGAFGVLSLSFFFLFISLAKELKPGEDAVEPLALLIAPLLINICYTSGWLFEILVRFAIGKRYRRKSAGLFWAGLVFSLAVTSLPAVWWATVWMYRLANGKLAP